MQSDWPKTIDVNMTESICSQIEQARSILKYNPFIRLIELERPADFVRSEFEHDLHELHGFKSDAIVVHDIYVHYIIHTADRLKTYDLTDFVPHSVVLEHERKTELIDLEISEYLGLGEQLEKAALFEVQTRTLCDGWINTWSVIDKNGESSAQTFQSVEKAQAEIDDFREEIKSAIDSGEIEPSEEELRIVKVSI